MQWGLGKIWNCLTWNSGYFETVCPGQPENLLNCLSKHKVNIFRAMLKNIINSKNCLFYIFFDLKCRRASTHIFCICLVQNCLSQVKISETVCESVLVLKLSVLKRTSTAPKWVRMGTFFSLWVPIRSPLDPIRSPCSILGLWTREKSVQPPSNVDYLITCVNTK